MNVFAQVSRAFVHSLLAAAIVASLALAVQLYVWAYLPRLSVVSLPYACAPEHAIPHSALVFVLVFCVAFPVAGLRESYLAMRENGLDDKPGEKH